MIRMAMGDLKLFLCEEGMIVVEKNNYDQPFLR